MNYRKTALQFLEDSSSIKLQEIFEVLTEADKHYTDGQDSFINDSEYDQIRLITERLDPTNEYFLGVGSLVRGDDAVKLPFPLGSLDQIQVGEIEQWVKDKGLSDETFIITDKMDGISVLLVYGDNGKLQIALTRGNGLEGQDITRHVKNIPDVPTQVSGKIAVRAEIEYSESDFIKAKKIATRKDGSEYKNPRNAVAGMMNQENIKLGAIQLLSVFAYDILGVTMSKTEQFAVLEKEGFRQVVRKSVKASELTDDNLSDYIKERKADLDFAIDGIVIDIDEEKTRKMLSKFRKRDSLNPAYAIKYKVQDASNIAITTVKSVEWNLSKHGFAKPKVKLEPFDLQGVTIQNTTGFNAKYILDNKIGEGAVVKMTRSGDVIPYIVEVLKPSNKVILPDLNEYTWSDNEVDLLLKNHNDNKAVKLKQLISWATHLEIPLLKEGNITELFNKGYDTPAKIVNITEPTMVAIVGKNGRKIMLGMAKKLKNVEPFKIAGAWPLFGVGVGVRKFKKLQAHLIEIDKPTALVDGKLTVSDVESCDGFETKTAMKVIAGMPDFLQFLKDIDGKYTIQTSTKKAEGKFSDEKIIFTGFRDKDLESVVESEGGEIVGSVSKKTTLVVALDPDAASGKTNKARDLGIKIMSKEDFEAMIGDKDEAVEKADKKVNKFSNFFE